MRVLVFGGRDYTDVNTAYAALDHLRERLGLSVVVHGAARGADAAAGRWANARRVPEDPYIAEWNVHGRGAGPIRNAWMLKQGEPEVAVEFPGGKGTADMRRRLDKAGIPVFQVYPHEFGDHEVAWYRERFARDWVNRNREKDDGKDTVSDAETGDAQQAWDW
jgi:hypothetical protein